MKRFVIYIVLAIFSFIISILNVYIQRLSGISIYSFKLFFVLPAGAVLAGMAVASGGVIAARILNVSPLIIDAFFMVLFSAATMMLIYYLDYATMVLEDGQKISEFISFPKYVDLVLTSSHMLVGRGHIDTGEVGRAGYWLAAAEFGGFLVGGLSMFLFLLDMERCAECSTYLKKLKTKKSKEVRIDDAATILKAVKAGDIELVAQAINWIPQNADLINGDDNNLILDYSLFICPKCKQQRVVTKVKVRKGGDWVDAADLTIKRDFASGEESLLNKFVD